MYKLPSRHSDPQERPSWLAFRPRLTAVVFLSASVFLAGCSRFHEEKHTHVYVSARQVYLHDRVAAVSNRVAAVTNGEALEVIEQGKRFVKVRTPKGEIGWLEDHAVIDEKLYAQFQELNTRHAADLVVAKAQLRDDLYLHVQPGRETPHFLLIAGNAKVDMLARGTVAKAPLPGAAPMPKPRPPVLPAGATPAPTAPTVGKAPLPLMTSQSKTPAVSSSPQSPGLTSTGAMEAVPAPIPMEDWWLVRDASGHTGWLLASRLDVDVPEEVGGYAEGARMIGAYALAKVIDSGVERKPEKKGKNGKPEKAAVVEDAPAKPIQSEHIEYLTVLAPIRGGLPYDFDQIRVFTWSLNHHRYETAYRLHGVQGYLPIRMGQETVGGQSEPTFSFEIANGPDVSIDPENGVTRPVAPRTLSFRLEGNLIRRTGSDQGPIILSHDTSEAGKAKTAKEKAAAKKKKR